MNRTQIDNEAIVHAIRPATSVENELYALGEKIGAAGGARPTKLTLTSGKTYTTRDPEFFSARLGWKLALADRRAA